MKDHKKKLLNIVKDKGTRFVKIPDSEIEHLRNKKFFEFSDFDLPIFQGAWCFIIKAKKGMGKSYQANKEMQRIDEKEGAKMLYIRTRNIDLDSTATSFMTSDKIPFVIKGGKLYSKKTGDFKGRVGYANNLGNLRSQDYTGYETIIYDEFVEQTKENYENIDIFAYNFMLFIMDVNRDYQEGKVSPIKVYILGNNNIKLDVFAKFFKLDTFGTRYQIDKDLGVVYANFGDFYEGMLQDTKAYGLSYYSTQMEDFLNSNISLENLSKYVNYSESQEGIIEYYLLYDKKFIRVIRKYDKEKKKFTDNYILMMEDNEIMQIPIYCFTQIDNIEYDRAILLNKYQIATILETLKHGIKHKTYKMTDDSVGELIDEIVTKFGKITPFELMLRGL